jgi:ribonuclease HI
VLRFVQAKSRLKPVKAAHTIPRMELLAAEMGLALAKKLVATLDIQHKDIHLWTDSRAVNDWLRVETRALQVILKYRVCITNSSFIFSIMMSSAMGVA